MPKLKEHAVIGAAVGIGAWFLYCRWTNRRFDLLEYALAGGAGATVALLPDVFEPALHPNHRGVLHSYTFAGVLTCATKRVWENPALSNDQKIKWSIGSLAYVSHLFADGQTPRGLPLIS